MRMKGSLRPALSHRCQALIIAPPTWPIVTRNAAANQHRHIARSLDDSVLGALSEAAAGLVGEEPRPRHLSAASLEDLNAVVASFKEGGASLACTNCTAPMQRGQALCGYCGHDSRHDAELLGQVPWTPAPAPGGAPASAAAPPGSVALATDERMQLHRTTLPPYPERPQRLQAIMARLTSQGLTQRCSAVPGREATDVELLAVHSPELVAALSGASPRGAALSSMELLEVLDPGMLVGEHTGTAARLAAGTATDVALAVATGKVASGVAVVRPPGHHASRDMAQGGCYFNNVAVAARAVQASGAAKRILIVDFDIHFGQGTQQIFDEDSSVLFVSLHREDREFYPKDMQGEVSNVGSLSGAGHSINLAWAAEGITDGDYLTAFMHVVMPVAYSFSPDMILVSAGFGAADRDFQGGCSVSPACYAHMTHMLKGIAPLALVLEGGYNLDQTARCMEACTRVLLGERPPPMPKLDTSPAGWVAVMNVMQVHGESWPALKALSWTGWMEVLKRQQREMEEAELAEGLEDEGDH